MGKRRLLGYSLAEKYFQGRDLRTHCGRGAPGGGCIHGAWSVGFGVRRKATFTSFRVIFPMGTFGRGSDICPCCCSVLARSAQNSSFCSSLRHSLASWYTCFNKREGSLSKSEDGDMGVGNSDVGEESKEELEDPGDKCVPIGYDDTGAEDMDFCEEYEAFRGMIVG